MSEIFPWLCALQHRTSQHKGGNWIHSIQMTLDDTPQQIPDNVRKPGYSSVKHDILLWCPKADCVSLPGGAIKTNMT